MDPDEFSDPIVIPITITIPNPFPRRHSGRFDQGPSYHPSFKDPTWFARQRGVGRPHYTPAQLALPFPLPAPITLPQSKDEITQTLKEMREMWARARRRAGHVEEEIGRGDFGNAAGHLLGGAPFPAEVDNGFVLNNEGGRPDLETMIDEIEGDVEKRLNDPLDERHREAARNDLLGKPVIDSKGRTRWHDEEVATNANGLEDRAVALEKKADYEEQKSSPLSAESIDRARALVARIRSILSDLDKEVPGLDKLRDEVRKNGTITRGNSTPGT